MKTAEELFKNENLYGDACQFSHDTEVISVYHAIRIAKVYARQCAKNALKEAANNKYAFANCTTMDKDGNTTGIIDRFGIMSIEIETP